MSPPNWPSVLANMAPIPFPEGLTGIARATGSDPENHLFNDPKLLWAELQEAECGRAMIDRDSWWINVVWVRDNSIFFMGSHEHFFARFQFPPTIAVDDGVHALLGTTPTSPTTAVAATVGQTQRETSRVGNQPFGMRFGDPLPTELL